MIDFSTFFREVHGHEPFPWQHMLADRVSADGSRPWPEVIELPTASGKTAVLDVAVWALAKQADRTPQERTAPRRIWLVVDRRIVVDEAFQRGERIRQALSRPALAEVAEALRRISGTDHPLRVARLRGGVAHDGRWARNPAQPAILTSTVDQIGSRLLFRSYGAGALSASVHAALVAYDSLIVLDEAHCAVPFMQTLRWVQHYRDAQAHPEAPPHDEPRWAEQPIELPLHVSVMSATPPENVTDRFPAPKHREAALDHALLHQRMNASKPAALIPVDKPSKPRKGPRPRETLLSEALEQITRFIDQGKCRIAVMVNRVETAKAIHEALETETFHIDRVLLTGRMRAIDRKAMIDQWRPKGLNQQEDCGGLTHWLGATADPPKLPRPIVLVTTQCLEVGADLSFDALISECASLDALRQRFGRLNRLGMPEWNPAPAAILAWKGDLAEPEKLDPNAPLDPVYGNALALTWDWLNQNAQAPAADESDMPSVDLGINAMERLLNNHPPAYEDKHGSCPLLAPTAEAPVMLPAYLDTWCQTGPRPAIEPEPALFLHGPDRDTPEAQVLWRGDLTDKMSDAQWAEAVTQCPPVSAEMMPVRLSRLRQYLAGQTAISSQFDVEGVAAERDIRAADESAQRFVIYRGRQSRGTCATTMSSRIRPNDIVVLPADEEALNELGHGQPHGGSVDAFELTVFDATGLQTCRLAPVLLEQWAGHAIAQESDDQRKEAREEALAEVEQWLREYGEDDTGVDVDDLLLALQTLFEDTARAPTITQLGDTPEVRRHPAGGVTLIGRPRVKRSKGHGPVEENPFADENDEWSRIGTDIPLNDHVAQTGQVSAETAERCLPAELVETLRRAGDWHDLGKLDPRFQGLLRNQPLPFTPRDESKALAKSAHGPSPRDHTLKELLGLPANWRHEALSMQLAQRLIERDGAASAHRDLLLHLIAAHHGHARPFLPITPDDQSPEVNCNGTTLTAEQRNDPPPYELEAGVTERFWRLTRRYGWWGLAYLEAVLRLADRHTSRFPQAKENDHD